jgi:CRISPR system Cascade subunit CasC
VDREFDFYTAVDDLNPKEETGAGMMGDVEFYSATLYRYAVVDLEKLLENLQGDKELAIKGAQAFLEAFALTLPSGKQNSFAAHNPPLFVAFRAGEGMPRNLATVFERPIRPREDAPLSRLSAEALMEEWARFDRVYGPLSLEWKGALDLTEAQGDGLPRLGDLKALKEKVAEAVRALLEV